LLVNTLAAYEEYYRQRRSFGKSRPYAHAIVAGDLNLANSFKDSFQIDDFQT